MGRDRGYLPVIIAISFTTLTKYNDRIDTTCSVSQKMCLSNKAAGQESSQCMSKVAMFWLECLSLKMLMARPLSLGCLDTEDKGWTAVVSLFAGPWLGPRKLISGHASLSCLLTRQHLVVKVCALLVLNRLSSK